jgi:hypothetical protein
MADLFGGEAVDVHLCRTAQVTRILHDRCGQTPLYAHAKARLAPRSAGAAASARLNRATADEERRTLALPATAPSTAELRTRTRAYQCLTVCESAGASASRRTARGQTDRTRARGRLGAVPRTSARAAESAYTPPEPIPARFGARVRSALRRVRSALRGMASGDTESARGSDVCLRRKRVCACLSVNRARVRS